jgi:hypothetical protein
MRFVRMRVFALASSLLAPRIAIPISIAFASPAAANTVKVKTDLYEFSFSYPATVVPPVKTILDRESAAIRAKVIRDSTSDRRQALKSNYPYRPHSSDIQWKVVTDLPGWLSLSSETYLYTGGAHGNTVFDTLLWDKAAKLRRKPLDLFVSPAALSAAVKAPFCAGLAVERKKKRGGEVWSNDIPEFSGCIDPIKDATVILGSRGGGRFTRIGFLIPPYAAGPYAEGSYQVTVPVTPAVLRAVKPQFRAAFAPG